jgi:hypothetical protein
MMLTRMIRGTTAGATLLATASTFAFVPFAANADTVANADVSIGALAASNPYLLAGPDRESGAASVTIRPYISATDDDTIATLEGALNLENFFNHYGTDESARLGASIEQRVDERTTVSAVASFQSSESSARHFYGGPDLGGLEPGEFPDSPVIDPTLGSISGRTSRLNVNLSLNQAVSTNGVVGLTAAMGLTRAESGNGSDYRNTSTALTYSRRLDERTSLLGSANVGYADYFGRRAGDGLFTTALVGVNHRFSESMYGEVQVGFSYATVKTLLGGREDVTDWAATLNLCNTLARGTLCATGSRAVQPTSLGGVTTVSSIGVSYAREIGADGNVSLTAGYTKSGMPDSSPILLGRRESDVANVSGSYTHRIGQRLSAFITPSFTSAEDEFAGKQENYQVLLGITYHFGKLR